MKIITGNLATLPIDEVRTAHVVLSDDGAVTKNAYGNIAGSPAALAIQQAHATYKAAIGTPEESQKHAELRAIVERVNGGKR